MKTYTINKFSVNATTHTQTQNIVSCHYVDQPYTLSILGAIPVKHKVRYSENDLLFFPHQYLPEELDPTHIPLLSKILTDNAMPRNHTRLVEVLSNYYGFLIPLPNDRNIDLIIARTNIVEVKTDVSNVRHDKDVVRRVRNQKSGWNIAGIRGKK